VWTDVVAKADRLGLLDLQHHLLKMTFGDRLSTYEPEEKKNLHNVLDIGTGTGIWAIEYGKRYPT
jgi:methylase of polypeptide subunit release factors